MTLSHNSNRLYSNPDYKQGGFTPFKFQSGSSTALSGLGSTDDVLGGASPDQISAAQIENIYTTNPNTIQRLLSGSSGTLLLIGGFVLGVFLIGNKK
jgi:hypothetical protein